MKTKLRPGWVLALLCTVLFFYALSGFLLKLVQLIKPLYLRGLNMFTLRQLGAKVNTTFASLSVVCIVLFLAITSVCGGIGIRNAIDGSLDRSTDYSASVSTSPSGRATTWPPACARVQQRWGRATSTRSCPARRRWTSWSTRPTAW